MTSRYRDLVPAVQCPSLLPLLSLLGGGLRLELIRHLSVRTRTVGALVELLEADYAPISQDLAGLRHRLLVVSQPQGNQRWYRLDEQVGVVVSDGRLTLHLATADGDELTLRTRAAAHERSPDAEERMPLSIPRASSMTHAFRVASL